MLSMPQPSLGVSSLDLGRSFSSGPFSFWGGHRRYGATQSRQSALNPGDFRKLLLAGMPTRWRRQTYACRLSSDVALQHIIAAVQLFGRLPAFEEERQRKEKPRRHHLEIPTQGFESARGR